VRFESLVVGMDFTDAAISAATWASVHFAPAASVTLLHVIDLPVPPKFGRHLAPPPREVEMEARAAAERQLAAVAEAIDHEATRTEIRVGRPHESIMRFAQEIGADLIVVGPHGARPRPSKFLGTTAERVVRTASVPVLVATQPPAGSPTQLLVAVDDASVTTTLLESARDLAETFHANVKLLHVWSDALDRRVSTVTFAGEGSDADARAAISNALHASGRAWLEEMAHSGIGDDRATVAIADGNPGDEILNVAAATPADLIVLGRRGSGLVARGALGRTLSTVLHGARCPVLVISEEPDSASDVW
jgi:nucleotide-binding universal stress UspA family protein